LARLLVGKSLADKIKEGIKAEVASFKFKPVLASIMVGENAGAVSYTNSQAKVAKDLGIDYQLHSLKQNSSESELVRFIKELNLDKSINGIIVQMPLPLHIDYKKISRCIACEKDIEGMNPENIGKVFFNKTKLIPCTAAAVMELILASGVDLNGKEIVIVGHSEIVGKPLALLLLDKLATVTVCHIGTSKAGKLEQHVRGAEILVVAVGHPNLIKGDWIREGAIVIDVGINRVGEKIVGDIEFEAAEKRASFITPVPGGVGPLTVTMLMRNLVEATKLQQGLF
jgi:methylenetetrahydrofolate dehydrogenase (NADP+)/methenyltetrahydrofolate cyclohydrolase